MTDKILCIYPHRMNAGGSFDSICPLCFRTIASAKTEAALVKAEEKHVCVDDHIARSRTRARMDK